MIAIRMLLVLTALTGLVYPLAVTGIAQLLFPTQANGSRCNENGRLVGSELIGRPFSDPKHFWPRPSATSPYPYNSASSTGSNYGPRSEELRKIQEQRRKALQAADPGNTVPVPIDLLTASGSGLDPDISPEAADYQAPRVAKLRGWPLEKVEAIVRRHTKGRQFGFLGEPRVNVADLNRDLDRQ